MSIAESPAPVNASTAVTPVCAPATAPQPYQTCNGTGHCICHMCAVARGRAREKRLRRVVSHPDAVKFVNMMRMAELLADGIRQFRNEHGERCRCRLCNFLNERDEYGGFWIDLLVLGASMDAHTSVLANDSPTSDLTTEIPVSAQTMMQTIAELEAGE